MYRFILLREFGVVSIVTCVHELTNSVLLLKIVKLQNSLNIE